MRLGIKLLVAGAFATVGAVAQAQEVGGRVTQGNQAIPVHDVLGYGCWVCDPFGSDIWDPYEPTITWEEIG